MTIKVGTEEDHALLMASIFRTCKHEELEDFDLFVKSELAKLVPRDAEDRALLTVNPEPKKKEGDITNAEGEEEELKEGDGTVDATTDKKEETKKEETKNDKEEEKK
jgi:hypothetical protein